VNRHDRRRHAARNRGRRTGYLHRVLDPRWRRLFDGKRGVFHTMIEHDGTCGIYAGQDCDCVPNISVIVDGVVHVIGENGEVVAKQKVS
jgi:hypothetical protein